MALLTAVAGPAAEIVLINGLHLYNYTRPDFLGIPSWITWVYFCGSPAVGNLSRQVRGAMRRSLELPVPVCKVEAASRRPWRPPPRGTAGALEQPR